MKSPGEPSTRRVSGASATDGSRLSSFDEDSQRTLKLVYSLNYTAYNKEISTSQSPPFITNPCFQKRKDAYKFSAVKHSTQGRELQLRTSLRG